MGNKNSVLVHISKNPGVFGLLSAILFSIFAVIILAMLFQFTSVSEVYLKPIGTFLYLVGAFLGGFLAAKKAGHKGLIYGISVGFCYYLFFVIISLFLSIGSLTFTALVFKGLYSLLVSAAGGICGLAFV